MSAGVVTFALLGAGGIGRLHAETIATYLRGGLLAVVVDPVEAHARAAAAWSEGARIEPSAEAVLAEAGIDAVVIASPTRTHAQLIEAAAAAGKHVFCEKPIALTLEDARRAASAAVASGTVLQIGFQRRFDAAYVAARDTAVRGELGAIELLASTTRDPTGPAPGYLASCGGMFLDTAIHDFDSIRFLSGEEVVEVYATASSLVTPEREGPYEIDTSVTLLRMASGALATVTNSLRSGYGYEAGAELYGSRGKIAIRGEDGAGLRRYGAGGVTVAYPQTYRQRFAEAYRNELADFVRCIAEGAEPRASGEDGVRALAIGLAATRSQREGRALRI